MDNYTMDELMLAFSLKFENNALEILQRLYEGTPVPVNEIDEILKTLFFHQKKILQTPTQR